nr:hypothetical protein [uncultured Duganella sp.]
MIAVALYFLLACLASWLLFFPTGRGYVQQRWARMQAATLPGLGGVLLLSMPPLLAWLAGGKNMLDGFDVSTRAPLVCALLPLLPVNATTMTSAPIPLSITLQCNDNPGCLYARKPMMLTVSIRNDGRRSIGFPLAYLSKSGPIVKYTDTATAAVTYERRGLANPALKTAFTDIAPGAAVTLETELSPQQLEAFRAKRTDVTVEVILKARVSIEGAAELGDFQGAARIRVVEPPPDA